MVEKYNSKNYKFTILGKVPVHWEEKTLDDIIVEHKEVTEINNQYPVLTSSRNGLVKQEEYYNNRQIITDNIGYHVIPRGYFTYRSRSDDSTFVFNINNIVDKGIVSYFYPVFRVVDANSYYVWVYINNFLSSQIKKEIVGTSQLVLSLNKFKKMKIVLPSLKEQQKIVDILSVVDEQIENTDQLINKAKELKKGLMQQLLTKGIGHTKFKQTEFGEVPVGWEITTLSEISDFITKGSTPTTYGYEWEESGIPFFKSDVVKEGRFVYGDFKFISEEAHLSMARSKILSGDILMTITGNIGRVAIVPKEVNEANINQHIAKIRVINKSVNSLFVYHWLNQEKIVKYYQLIKTGLAYPQISLKQVRETIVPIPKEEEQLKISEILSTVDQQIESYELEKEKYTELKKGLMQQLLTGKIRVTV